MTQLSSRINARSDEFKTKHQEMAAVVADLKQQLHTIEQGGGAVARERHLSRGKLLPRQRVENCSMLALLFRTISVCRI